MVCDGFQFQKDGGGSVNGLPASSASFFRPYHACHATEIDCAASCLACSRWSTSSGGMVMVRNRCGNGSSLATLPSFRIVSQCSSISARIFLRSLFCMRRTFHSYNWSAINIMTSVSTYVAAALAAPANPMPAMILDNAWYAVGCCAICNSKILRYAPNIMS